VLGLRVGRVPPLPGVAILNGFAGIDPDTGVEGFARVPYPLAGELEMEGRTLSETPEYAQLLEQTYDFSCGELRTRYRLDAGDVTGILEVLTLCSRTMPMVVLQEVVVQVERACDIRLEGGVDHTGVLGTFRDRRATPRGGGDDMTIDGSLLWESHGGLSRCGIAYVTELGGNDATPEKSSSDAAPLMTRYAFRARSGRRYRLRQIAALVGDATHDQPDLQAVRLAYSARERGFDRLREENRRRWEELWRGRVNLVGAPARWQAMADAAFFYLHTSVHPSSPASTSIFGLSYWPNYHYYRGHVMWDIDVFCVPPLILTQPDAARTLLEFRADRAPYARHNASMNGYRGLQFPWESTLRSGAEAAPGEGAAAAHEHHISPDIAFAFSQYLHATHDWEWGRERAWAVLEGVAEWIASRGIETKRGFEIQEVGGIAEKQRSVDNNAFVNVAAGMALREATRLARPLGHQAHPLWSRLAESMFIPVDRNGVIRNHDAYRRTEEKGETPEAAAALFPLAYECPAEVERATLEFYLEFAKDYAGAPMLSALLGVYAARVGDRALSLELFERGYAKFVIDPFSVTTEYDKDVFPDQPVAAPFAANLAGFLLSCIYGLPGVRIGEGEPSDWCSRPVTMPSGWDAVEMQIVVRGRRAALRADHGAECAVIEVA
jgi:trehalose/maltose hydrolase-like predicted phosphorylase